MFGYVKVCTMTEEDHPTRGSVNFITSTVMLPSVTEEHEWSLWKEIIDGFDNSPDWDISAGSPGHRVYRNRDERSLLCSVTMEGPKS
jgi:hypothetical protein